MELKIKKSKNKNTNVAASVSVPNAIRENFEEKKAELLSVVKQLGVRTFSALVQQVVIHGKVVKNEDTGEYSLIVKLK